MPGTTPCVDSRSGNLYFYLHPGVRADVPSDRTAVQEVATSHGPVLAVSYSMPGMYRT